jgi:hypothetical protein
MIFLAIISSENKEFLIVKRGGMILDLRSWLSFIVCIASTQLHVIVARLASSYPSAINNLIDSDIVVELLLLIQTVSTIAVIWSQYPL